VHWVGLELLYLALLYLLGGEVAGAVFTEEEIPECVHQGHLDALATASHGQIQEKRVVAVQFRNNIGVLYSLECLLARRVQISGQLGCDSPQEIYRN